MINVVIEKWNVVGVWYTYDQIIPTGVDWLLCAFNNFQAITTYCLLLENQELIPEVPPGDYKKCQLAISPSVAYGTHWDPSGNLTPQG